MECQNAANLSVFKKEQTTLTPPLYLVPLLAPLSKRRPPPDVPSKRLIEMESFSSWAHIDSARVKCFRITFARDWGSPQIIGGQRCYQGLSAAVPWAKCKQLLFRLACTTSSGSPSHLTLSLCPSSALLSKYLPHISGIRCSSCCWFSPFGTRFCWIFGQSAGCGKSKYLSVALLSICFTSHGPWYFHTGNNRKFETR